MVILQAIIAALQFPQELGAFIKLLQATPQEQHEALMVQIQSQAASFKATGRPS